MYMPRGEFERLLGFKNQMRHRPTKGESQFKNEILRILKGRYGIEFISQKMMLEVKGARDKKGYILDFYLPSLQLAIEVDGKSHNSKQAKLYDQIRDSLAAKRGIRVIRFTNTEVKDVETAIRRLYGEIERWQEYNRTKASKKPLVQMSREEELRMQDEFIKSKGITKLPEISANRKPIK